MHPGKEVHAEVDARARGSQNYKEGYAFEEKVAEAYRLLGYRVEQGRVFKGRQIDLFLELNLADLRIRRVVECKAGNVDTDDLDKFIIKLKLAKQEYPDVNGVIVSGLGFTDAVNSHAPSEAIQLTLYRDLSAQILDGPSYAQWLVREIQQNERYIPELFVQPHIAHDPRSEGIKAFEVIDEWLADSQWRQLTLLGDVGTGKSFLSRMVALRLAQQHLQQPLESPLPLLFDLRNADREFSLEGLVLTHFARHGLARATFDSFQFLLSEGKIVVILDGFDEMASRVTPLITTRNFNELARCVKRNAKVLLTCRTHYFKSRTEEEEVVLGGSGSQSSEVARDLYWDLISRTGFKIEYLRPFSVSEVEEYVRKVSGQNAQQVLGKIHKIYNLAELSQRPLLLEMIVKSIDKFTTDEVNSAQLYNIFTSAWVHRDKWRDLLTPEEKLKFLTALARSLWEQEKTAIDYHKLQEYIGTELAGAIDSPQKLIELDGEIRTASFLIRDDAGQYGFAHSSYAEYFLARDLAEHLKKGNVETLLVRRLTNEVVDFLLSMVDKAKLEKQLTTILCSQYRPLLSENALVLLYRLRRNLLIAERVRGGDGANLKVELPSNIRLQNAKLAQINLEGAIAQSAFFDGADLSQCIARGADFSGSSFLATTARAGDFEAASLRGANFETAQLSESNFQNADVSHCNFIAADLGRSVFTVKEFEGTQFTEASFTSAVLPAGKESVFLGREEIKIGVATDYERGSALLLASRTARRYARKFGAGIDADDVAADVTVFLVSHPTELTRVSQKGTDLERLVQDLTWKRLKALRRTERLNERAEVPQLHSEQGLEYGEMPDEKVPWAQVENLDLDKYPAIDSPTRTAEAVYAYTELLEILGRSLSKDSLRMLIARYVDERSVEDIASAFQIPEIEVVRKLNKARELARKALSP